MSIAASVSALMFLLTPPTGLRADPAAKPARAAIYDESADGGKQVEEGLVRAKKENKHVLLTFLNQWAPSRRSS